MLSYTLTMREPSSVNCATLPLRLLGAAVGGIVLGPESVRSI